MMFWGDLHVKDILINPDNLAFIEDIISLSKAFNREVIAKGVETTSPGIVPMRIGCDRTQGYAVAACKSPPQLAETVQIYCTTTENTSKK